MDNSQQPAFPYESKVAAGTQQDREFKGLTKREYFAIKCLQGLLSDPASGLKDDRFIKVAICYADDLLKQLKNGE